MRRFPASPLPAPGETSDLDATSAHHFRTVLRGRVGQVIELFDGESMTARAEVVHVDNDTVTVRILSTQRDAVEHACVLVLAVLKGPAMDTAIRMATEAGATAIWPVLAQRSVATGDRSDRWERIATAAAKQCGRASIPEVRAPVDLATVLEALSGHHMAIAHTTAELAPAPTGDRAILVGPEGGWTDGELRQCTGAGAHAVSLGPYVLRADTAAAVGTALMHQRPS